MMISSMKVPQNVEAPEYSKNSTACPICESSQTRLVQNQVKGSLPSYKTLSGVETGPALVPIKVYRCEECSLDFLETWKNIAMAYGIYRHNDYVLKKDVTRDYCKFDELRNRTEAIRPYLTPQTKFLDLGCAEGLVLKAIAPYVKVAEGTEICDYYVQKLKSEGFKIWSCDPAEMRIDAPYDIVSMHAFLEHIPNILDFLTGLKKIIHKRSQIFIEIPNLRDPLAYYYDIENYRNFFYRKYHLYYFTETSLGKLLKKAGFDSEIKPLQAASISNHFHWLHQKKGQANTNEMVKITLPNALLQDKMPNGKSFDKLLDEVDNFYRQKLVEAGIGDLLSCRAWLS